MHLERGPSSTTFVFVLQQGMSVVPHAFERMRSDGVPFILPIYLRDVFGERQICADVTGLLPIADIPPESLIRDEEFFSHLKDFLLTPILMEDYFLSSDFLIADPRFVFWDARTRSMYWLAVPVNPTCGFLYSAHEIFPDRMRRIISCPFFEAVLRNKDTGGWLSRLDPSDEQNYFTATEILFAPAKDASSPEATTEAGEKPQVHSRLFLIAGFCSVMLLLALCGSLFGGPFHLYFPVIAFCSGVAMLLLLISWKRKQYRQDTENQEDHEDTHPVPVTGNIRTRVNMVAAYPDAFIERIDDARVPATKAASSQRFPLLLQDCLIGRDMILCDIYLDDPSISDRHARILKRSGTYFLMDAGSYSGTFLGDCKLYSYEENPLSDQDTFAVGDIRFVFRLYGTEKGD